MPSRLRAAFITKKGRFFSWKVTKTSLSLLASSESRPTLTSMPAFRRASIPFPFTCGFGSNMATTTFLMPALITASTQGGVLFSVWQHGSRVTTSVAPRAAVACPLQGDRLGVGFSRLAVVSLSQDALSLHHQGAYHRVRRRCSQSLFCKGKGQPHEVFFFHVSPFFKSRLLQLFHELGNILELAVNGGEPHVGDLVEPLQLIHHHPSYLRARDLFLSPLRQAVLDPRHRFLEIGNPDRPLFAGLSQARQDFPPVEGLSPAVFLDDERQTLLQHLRRAESLRAPETFAAPPDGVHLLARSRIDYLAFGESAIRTFHRTPLAPRARKRKRQSSFTARRRPSGRHYRVDGAAVRPALLLYPIPRSKWRPDRPGTPPGSSTCPIPALMIIFTHMEQGRWVDRGPPP